MSGVRTVIREGLLGELDDKGPSLLASRCRACSLLRFPVSQHCPYCSASAFDVVPLSRRGRLEVVTTVTSPPPGYGGPIPYGLGVVELAEGLRVIARIRNPGTVTAGGPVRLVLEDVGAGQGNESLLAYAFEESTGSAPEIARVAPSLPAAPSAAPLGPRGVYVAGVGLHAFGRFADKSTTDLGVTAVAAALKEAGVKRVDAAYCGTVYGGVATGHKILSALGYTGMPIVNVEAGCASGAAALQLAASAIANGAQDTVLVFGVEKMPKGMVRSSFFEPWQERAGLAATPAYFALRAQRLMRDSGVTLERLAQVSVKNHRHGVHNPLAMYRQELTQERVLASPTVCDPLRLLMLCSPNEGAAALVISSKPSPVRVRAVALRSHFPGNVLGEHTPMSGLVCDNIPSPTDLAAQAAYEASSLGPQDLHVAEVQDTDCARELLSYEELGFCARGAAAQYFADGTTQMGGALPVNPSGGLLSKGEPLGASALAQVIELYWQLRGEAGPRQVDNARVALAHCVGRGANAAVTILSR